MARLFYVDDTGVAEEELQPGCRFIKEEGKVVLGDWSPGDRGPGAPIAKLAILSLPGNLF